MLLLASVDEKAVSVMARIWDAIPTTNDRLIAIVSLAGAALACGGIGFTIGKYVEAYKKPKPDPKPELKPEPKPDEPPMETVPLDQFMSATRREEPSFDSLRIEPLSMTDYMALESTFKSVTKNKTALQRGAFPAYFAGRRFEWTGVVVDVVPSGYKAQSVVDLTVGPEDHSTLFHFNLDRGEDPQQLAKGDRVSLTGIMDDYGWFQKCRIVKVHPKISEPPHIDVSAPPSLATDKAFDKTGKALDNLEATVAEFSALNKSSRSSPKSKKRK